MPRKSIPLVTGEKYHIYNRGVDKRNIFSNTKDYERFFESLLFFNTIEPITNYRLAKSSNRYNTKLLVKIIAYCLLPNHFHLIVEQEVDGGLSEYMKRVTGGYTAFFNQKYKRSGSLFQGTFKRVHIATDEQFNYLFAYVNENYSVHNIVSSKATNNSSSSHYQKKEVSRLIHKNHTIYNHKSAVLLAKDINKKRKNLKDILE